MTRSTAQARLTAVGRALRSALAAPRSVARRAYGRESANSAAVSASPIAATWPMAGAPRTIISRIAKATSPADRQSYSTSASGSCRWSMRYRTPASSRNGVRNPLGAGSPANSASRCRRARRRRVRVEERAGRLGRRALERLGGTGHGRRRLDESPANWRKNRRRPRSTCRDRRGRGWRPARRGSGAGVAARPGARSRVSPSVRVRSSAGSANGWAFLGSRRSVLDDAGDPASVEPVAALEEFELDQERQADDLALEPLDQLDRALDGAAGREQVVDDQDLLAGLDGVAVDLEGVRPYSRAYSTEIVSAGSLPSLRTGTRPASIW